MATKSVELAKECKRRSEGCLYTSTSFFIYLRYLRWLKVIFIVVPLVLGALASWSLLTTANLAEVRIFTAVCAFIAGLMPSIYSALKFDDHLEQSRELAGEFKNLQDLFRHAALVSSKKPFSEFDADVKPLIERMDKARGAGLTPPEWFFRRAQTKIKSGDYDFDIDEKEIDRT